MSAERGGLLMYQAEQNKKMNIVDPEKTLFATSTSNDLKNSRTDMNDSIVNVNNDKNGANSSVFSVNISMRLKIVAKVKKIATIKAVAPKNTSTNNHKGKNSRICTSEKTE